MIAGEPVDPLAPAAAGLLRAEAVPAVDRPIAAWLERDFGLAAAVRARRRVHLARARGVATTATTIAAAPATIATTTAVAAAGVAARRFACTTAIRAALRLVGEAAARVKLLIVSGKNELRTT